MTQQFPPEEALRLLYRQDLISYVLRAFAELRGDAPFHEGFHIRAICHLLERVARGEVKRAMILMPPRHLKSTVASVAFSAWMMGNNPGARILAASYGSDLAETFNRDTRRLLESDFHKAVFPECRLDRRKAAASELRTTLNGYRLARSVHGPITGHGGDLVIIDDPMKAEDAFSETMREKVLDWYRGTTVTRLDQPMHGAIVLIMQRLHEDDLAGQLIQTGDWEVLELPAIETRARDIPLAKGMVWPRRPGDILLPEHMDGDALERVRREIGSRAFEAQYQQSPSPAGGNIIRPEWFGTIPLSAKRQHYEAILQSWDTAAVPGESNDYSVCTTWGLLGNHIDLLDVHREKYCYPDLVPAAMKLRQRWKPHLLVVETAGGIGYDFYYDLQRKDYRGIRSNTPKSSKVDRMVAQSALLESGQVRLPEAAPWREAFIAEVAGFPNGKYDDQVDSMSQALFAIRKQAYELRHCSRYKG